jgi:hypothetical protein
LTRLRQLAAYPELWAKQVEEVKRMRAWVLEAEHILDGSWATPADPVSNEQVAKRFDRWRTGLAERLSDDTLSEIEHTCLQQFLQVLANMRPYLFQCYDCPKFPRTNNDMEREIRAIKTRYRRISGRKNWNSYLLRYGRCVVFYEWWEQEPDRALQLEQHLRRVSPQEWRQQRKLTTGAQCEQLKRFRFRRKRATYLASLEARWEMAAQSGLLP